MTFFQKMIKNLLKGSRVRPGHYACPLWNIIIYCICFHVWVIFGKFLQPLIICLPFFKVWPLKKQDKDDFKPNLNLFLFLSRRNANATFKRYQLIFSKKIGCKTYLSLLNPFFMQKTDLYNTRFLGPLFLKIDYWIFFKKIVNSFYYVLENVTISIFSHFLASNLFWHSFFMFMCCI